MAHITLDGIVRHRGPNKDHVLALLDAVGALTPEQANRLAEAFDIYDMDRWDVAANA
jgi:plasmid maintenance system antidote protein VapI